VTTHASWCLKMAAPVTGTRKGVVGRYKGKARRGMNKFGAIPSDCTCGKSRLASRLRRLCEREESA
jgi:hypothetical protein